MRTTWGAYETFRSFNPPRDSGLRNLHFKKPTNNRGVSAVGYIVVRASKTQMCCFTESKLFIRCTVILYTTMGKKRGCKPHPSLRHVIMREVVCALESIKSSQMPQEPQASLKVNDYYES